MHSFIEDICDNPVIAAAQSREALEAALAFGVSNIILLGTDIFSAKACVDAAKSAGSRIFLHMDLIDGLASGSRALDYVYSSMEPSGIISTHTSLIKYAREQGIFCIQRFFAVDSASLGDAVRTAARIKPSMAELMPGIIPGVIQRFTQAVDIPVIAGGLITQRQEAVAALSAGAVGISTSCRDLWHE
ncbi:MAG: glycerol-3-phosphate responsive antiterminator [Christensenellales bacterium]